MHDTDIVRGYYNETVEKEWNRIAGRPEFLLTVRFLDRYVHPGDRVLDIGGGPGRYSLYLAQKGCEVTLFDLAEENLRFAQARASEQGLSLHTVCGDARMADRSVEGVFDCVLLMGPLYHLLDECDRIRAVEAALRLLRPGGVLFASFINLYAGLIYYMKSAPESVLDAAEAEFIHRHLIPQRSFAGDAFTRAFFIRQDEIAPFFAQFPLRQLHLFGQESILSPCESSLMCQSSPIREAWLGLAEKLCEREEVFSWSEHLMYVGRKEECSHGTD